MASAAAKEGACPSRSYPGLEPNGYRKKMKRDGRCQSNRNTIALSDGLPSRLAFRYLMEMH